MEDPKDHESLSALDAVARQHFHRGDFQQAIGIQKRLVNSAKNNDSWKQAAERLAMSQVCANNFEDGLITQSALVKRFPADPSVRANYGAIFARLDKLKRARKEMEKALLLGADSIYLHNSLAYVYGQLRLFESSRFHGQKALVMKDKLACSDFEYVRFKLNERKPRAFDYNKPTRNVIAFGLWGNDARYLNGALRNIELCPVIYPGWNCRFYIDNTVPPGFLNALKKHVIQAQFRGYVNMNVQLVKMIRCSGHYDFRTIWRFHVANDNSVDRFLVRDADSVINIKERVAVDEWLRSGKRFHVMRDNHAHTELILAGMWGGVAGVLPPVNELLKVFTFDNPLGLDQVFLRKLVWPLIKADAKIHDRHYHGVLNGEPFSDIGTLPPDKHIGQNEHAWAIYSKCPEPPG